MDFTIPGGKEKGVALGEASESTLQWWAQNGKREDLKSACIAELRRRAGGQGTLPGTVSETTAVATQADLPAVRGMYAELDGLAKAVEVASSRANFLAPVTRIDWIPEMHGVSMRLVQVNPAENAGDVYCPDTSRKGELALTKTALDKVAAAAGISWDAMSSARLDDGSNPHYCRFRAVGYIQDFDGAVRQISGEKEVDLRDGSATYLAWETQARGAARDGDNWEYKFQKRLQGAREHIQSLAESKAKNRAIRQALCIKSKYSQADLKKPFVIPRLVFTGHTDDPELKRMIAEKIADRALNASAMMYGPQQIQQQPRQVAQQEPHRLPPPAIGNDEPVDWEDGADGQLEATGSDLGF